MQLLQRLLPLGDGVTDLDTPLKTVLQVPARRIIRKEGKARLGGLPHARFLVQPLEELIHCGGAIKTNHLVSSIGKVHRDAEG